MHSLIKINNVTMDGEEINSVDARELHEFLGVGTRFDKWIDRRIEEYEFIEGIDYWSFLTVRSDGLSGKNPTQKTLTTNMAKELSMVEKNKKGREARKYFIECEKKSKQIQNQIKEPVDLIGKIEQSMRIAKSLGIKGNKAIKFANEMVIESHGMNFIEHFKIDHLLSPKQYFTTATIARDLGLSTQEVNKMIENIGLQYKSTEQELQSTWIVTNKGLKYIKLLENGNVPVGPIKWSMQVLTII